MRRSERQGDQMVWGAMGLGLGLLAGFVLAEAVGAVDRGRLARAVRRIGSAPASTPLSSARAVHAAALALAQTPGLDELEARALGPGRVELCGWVPDRRRRALAERTVAALEGIDGVVNRILVQAEDPIAPVGGDGEYALSLADQSA